MSATPFLTEERFDLILRRLPRTVRLIQFYFQGEPLLNPALPVFIAKAHDRGLYTTLSTNAQALTPALAEALLTSGLNRIIVSMDGLSQETYGAYRVGGSVDKVRDGLRVLRATKDRLRAHTHIELQCLYLRSNKDEWQAFRETYRALGADSLTFKTAQFYDYADGNELMPDEAHSRYRQRADGHYVPKHRVPRWCRRLLTGCVITTDGDVLPCCYDKEHRYVLGNLLRQDFAAIWHGSRRRTFLRRFRAVPICANCGG